MSKRCPECKEVYTRQERYCTTCGTRLQTEKDTKWFKVYDEGTKILVEGTVIYAKIINGRLYYKIKEATEIIPADIIIPEI